MLQTCRECTNKFCLLLRCYPVRLPFLTSLLWKKLWNRPQRRSKVEFTTFLWNGSQRLALLFEFTLLRFAQSVSFHLQFNRLYNGVEHENRFAIFKAKFEEIEKHNALFHLGQESFTLGLNQFSDMTNEEYKKLLGFNPSMRKYSSSMSVGKACTHGGSSINATVDWRTHGAGNFCCFLDHPLIPHSIFFAICSFGGKKSRTMR